MEPIRGIVFYLGDYEREADPVKRQDIHDKFWDAIEPLGEALYHYPFSTETSVQLRDSTP